MNLTKIAIAAAILATGIGAQAKGGQPAQQHGRVAHVIAANANIVQTADGKIVADGYIVMYEFDGVLKTRHFRHNPGSEFIII